MTTYTAWISPVVLLGLSLSGCLIHVDDHDDGTLSVTWSLDSTFDPEACLDFGASSLELVIYDDYGDVVDDPVLRCADFGVSIDLPEGEYALDATLLDRSGRSVSTTLQLEGIDVVEGYEEPLEIDFPIDSIR